MRSAISFILRVVFFGFLFVAALARAECFTADQGHQYLAKAGAVPGYSTNSPVAVSLASSVIGEARNATSLSIYFIEREGVAVLVFYSNECVANSAGEPARTGEDASLYLMPIDHAKSLIAAMDDTTRRHQI